MNIDEARALCRGGKIVLTQHCLKRIIERGIEIASAKQAILEGEVIEEYPDDYPYPSALVLGGGLHVVAAIGDGALWIITVYRPDEDQWEPDLKTRKVKRNEVH